MALLQLVMNHIQEFLWPFFMKVYFFLFFLGLGERTGDNNHFSEVIFCDPTDTIKV